jgi:lipopolysaccharide/colanic/teichoic acid biosynthesis glycosyltransferase
MVYPDRQWHEGVRLWIDGFLAIMGTNLLVQCGLAYLFHIPPASWFIIIVGSAFSIALTGLVRGSRRAGRSANTQGVLFLGFDSSTSPLVCALKHEMAGGVRCGGNDGFLPPVEPSPVFESLEEACEATHPSSIVLTARPDEIPFEQLLQLHYAGVDVEGLAPMYERVLQRVAWEHLQPADMLFFLNPNTSPAMLAFQAVYKNLLGLTLRVIFAPLLILTSLLIVAFTGGPALEHIECLGFRRIPFQMLRFRTCRSDGTPSRIGSLIGRLHLTNLPQLMNVVRGEMTLFGPAPVRTAFANRLTDLLPAYLYRFTVKPGIFGWPDASREETGELPDDARLLELDLYYVKQESPSLDLDILLRMLFRKSTAKQPAAAVSNIASHS